MHEALADENQPIADTWNAKRRALSGTPIPLTFPAYATLAGALYEVLEEVQGATETELINAGLTSSQSAAVIAAME